MPKLNSLQYHKLEDNSLNCLSLDALVSNDFFDELSKEYKNSFGFKKFKTFSFSKEGFLGLFLELNSKIAVSLGESKAIIDGAKLYEKLGFQVQWLSLNKDGKVNLYDLENKDIDFLFLSSYVMDTFVKTSLKEVKSKTKAKIISNATAHKDSLSDIIYFDSYKLFGLCTSSVLLFNNEEFEQLSIGQTDTLAVKYTLDAIKKQNFDYDLKQEFLEELRVLFKDDIYFFVEPNATLEYSLHFGLKGIKARELIRTLALNKIFISNGEGCSLGLSKPSQIIQQMGYDELTSRNSISLSFYKSDEKIDVKNIVKTIYLKYRQIKALNDE